MIIGLQLYSIRDLITEDNLWETLQKVRDAGYNAVEFAGYYDVPADEMKQKLDEIGLKPYSSHVPLDQLRDELDEVVDYAKTVGLEWVICPFAELKDKEEIDEVAKILLEAKEALQPHGIKVGYHNHSHEFKKIDDEFALDLLRKAVQDQPIYFEVDCCWARYAGVNPAEYLDELGQSMGPIHFKDLNENYEDLKPQEIDAVVGQGIVDFDAVLKTMQKNDTLKYGVIVEQEAFATDPWEELTFAANWIRTHFPE